MIISDVEMWQVLILLAIGVAGYPLQTCNDRYGSAVPLDMYNHRSCTMCYTYLFEMKPIMKPLIPMGDSMDYLGPRLTPGTETHEADEISTPIHPDIQNQTITNMVCKTLSEDESRGGH